MKPYLARKNLIGTAMVSIAGAWMLHSMLSQDARLAVWASETSGESTNRNPAARVEVVAPQRETLTRELRMPATLRAYESVDLLAKTSGYVETIHVDIGTRVRKGDPLIVIDVPEMHDDLRRAQAVLAAKRAHVEALKAQAEQAALAVESARAETEGAVAGHELSRITLQRKQELFQGSAIPQQEFDEAQSRLHITEAAVKIAEARVANAQGAERAAQADVLVSEAEAQVAAANLARLNTLMQYATIRAPFDGMITQRMADHGDFVRSAAEGETRPLLTIVRDDRIRLTLAIPESDAPHVRVGTTVRVRVKALGGEPVEAKVSRTAGALRPDTRTLHVEVDLENADGRLAPGMYAHAVVLLESKAQALMIPSKAVRVRGTDISVLVADESVARSMPIHIGYDDGIRVEVLQGLAGDERIIVGATSAVAPGAPVRVVPSAGVESSGDRNRRLPMHQQDSAAHSRRAFEDG